MRCPCRARRPTRRAAKSIARLPHCSRFGAHDPPDGGFFMPVPKRPRSWHSSCVKSAALPLMSPPRPVAAPMAGPGDGTRTHRDVGARSCSTAHPPAPGVRRRVPEQVAIAALLGVIVAPGSFADVPNSGRVGAVGGPFCAVRGRSRLSRRCHDGGKTGIRPQNQYVTGPSVTAG